MSAAPQTATEVILIDPSVSDYKTLIAGLSPDIPVILLPEGGDGLTNLAEALSGYQNLSSVHLVSHGSSGQLQLGDQPIDAEALSSHTAELQQLAQVFAPGADLMLYGCTVAAGEQGEAFVGQLSKALGGVDIAASNDRTGPLSLGGDWDLEYQDGEIESVLPFSVAGMQDIDHCLGCSDPGYSNASTCTSNGYTWTPDGDTTAPRVTSIDRQNPTSETTNADSLTFSVAFSESVKNVDTADFTVSGTTATVTNVSGSGSSYTVTISGGDLATLDGTVTLGFAGGQDIQDNSNNSLSDPTPTGTDNNSYTLDNTAPTITSISIPNAAMKVGDTVPVTITVADDGGDTYTNLSGTVGGFALGALNRIDNTTYTAQFTVTDGGSDVTSASDIPVNFTLSDSAGNTSSAFNTALSQTSDSIDANIPVITSVSIPDQAYNVGDAITVTIVAGEAGLSLNTGTVNGVAVTGFTDQGGGTYTATYTVQEGDTDRAAGDAIPVSFVLDDAAGNSSTTYSTAISQSADAIDANAPSVNSVSIPNTNMKVGDTVTVTITVADDGGDTYTNLSGTVGGFALSALSRTDNTTYTAQFTVTEGGTDVAAGSDIPVNFTLDDSAGNTSAAFTTAISQSSDSIDANNPVITSVSIPDQAANVGDAITVTIVASEAGLSLNTGTVNGVAVTGFSDAGGGTYTATYTVQEGDTDRAAGDAIPVSFVLDDAAGNSSVTYSTAISQSADAIDANAPSVSSVSIPNTNMKVGDTVTVTIAVADDGGDTYTNLSGTVGGFALSALSRTDNTTYTAQLTITEGGSDIEAGSDIPVNLTLTDSAGNTSSSYITAITQNADELDANSPGTPTGTLDIDENSANTTAVGAVTGGGSDGITYTLTDTAGGRFAIDTSGNLTVADGSLLDFETDTSHNITVRATDNAGNFTDNTLQVSVNDVNDAPTAADTTASMSYNASYTFTADDFGFSDVDTGDTLDHITIKALPLNGTLNLNGTPVTVSDTQVTLAELDSGKLVFTPASGGTGNDYANFTFTVSDGTDDSVTANTVTLNVGAKPVTPPPTPEPEPEPAPNLIDGATVEENSTTENGQQVAKVTISPITSDREDTDSNTSLADIPLHFDENDAPVTTLSLPVGIGATARANETAIDQTSFRDGLYLLRDSAPASDWFSMINGMDQWLNGIGAGWLNQVTFTSNSNEAPSEPIKVSGVEGDKTEVMVIDASQLPAGTVIDLDNIEFAIIVGDVQVRGGSGSNVVFAGSGNQNIVLGEDDDELHGGDGDDTVGSEGGDDLLFGENGNDTLFGGTGKDQLHGGMDNDIATYEGNFADYLVEQSHGVVTVTRLDDDTDVDTLINIEQIQFADQNWNPVYDTDLSIIATLYQQILGRQADVGGFQYWSDTADSRSKGQIALEFLTSDEYQQDNSFAFEQLPLAEQIEQLYQGLLGRSSDLGGKEYWTEQLAEGMDLSQVAEGFVYSDELNGQLKASNSWDFFL